MGIPKPQESMSSGERPRVDVAAAGGDATSPGANVAFTEVDVVAAGASITTAGMGVAAPRVDAATTGVNVTDAAELTMSLDNPRSRN